MHFPDRTTVRLVPQRWRQALCCSGTSTRVIEIEAKVEARNLAHSQFRISRGPDLDGLETILRIKPETAETVSEAEPRLENHERRGYLHYIDSDSPILSAVVNLDDKSFELLWARLHDSQTCTFKCSLDVCEVVMSSAGDVTWVFQQVNPIPIQSITFEFPCNWESRSSMEPAQFRKESGA
jgi:hypothetical protein